MPGTRPDLLKPTLSPDVVVVRPPFADVAVFLAALLGGPVAALGMFGANVGRLDRVPRDAGFLAAGVLVYGFWMLSPYGEASVLLSSYLGDMLGTNGRTLMLRLLALSIFVIAMLRHRREQRSADLFALARPSPWLPAIFWIVAGSMIDHALRGMRA